MGPIELKFSGYVDVDMRNVCGKKLDAKIFYGNCNKARQFSVRMCLCVSVPRCERSACVLCYVFYSYIFFFFLFLYLIGSGGEKTFTTKLGTVFFLRT